MKVELLMERFVCESDIPDTLWNKAKQTLFLPAPLIDRWKTILKANNLFLKASTDAPESFVGGMSKEDTDNHFAWRFNGSCARIILSLLDPKNELSLISDVYAKFFSGNKLFIVDLPSGSGAASAALLTTISELRKQNILPREPLYVTIVGGEISTYAQEYAKSLLISLQSEFNDQAIWIDFKFLDWDVCNPISNSDLVRKLTLIGQDCNSRLIILANFSDFLHKQNKWDKAKAQLAEIFRHSRDNSSVAIWIEPSRNEVKQGFFKRISTLFSNIWGRKASNASPSDESMIYAESNCLTDHPLRPGCFRTNLVIKHFELPMDI